MPKKRGRKKLSVYEKRVIASFRVSPKTKELLNVLRGRGIKIGYEIDRLADRLSGEEK